MPPDGSMTRGIRLAATAEVIPPFVPSPFSDLDSASASRSSTYRAGRPRLDTHHFFPPPPPPPFFPLPQGFFRPRRSPSQAKGLRTGMIPLPLLPDARAAQGISKRGDDYSPPFSPSFFSGGGGGRRGRVSNVLLPFFFFFGTRGHLGR